MGFNPLSILGGPIKGLVDSIGGILDNLTTTDKEKLDARNQLASMTLSFQAKMADAFTTAMETQSKIIVAEASGSWLQRNWRPMFAMVLVSIVAFNFLIVPIFSLQELPLPPDLWETIKLCLGGYIGGRTLEKIVVPAVQAYTATKDKSDA